MVVLVCTIMTTVAGGIFLSDEGEEETITQECVVPDGYSPLDIYYLDYEELRVTTELGGDFSFDTPAEAREFYEKSMVADILLVEEYGVDAIDDLIDERRGLYALAEKRK